LFWWPRKKGGGELNLKKQRVRHLIALGEGNVGKKERIHSGIKKLGKMRGTWRIKQKMLRAKGSPKRGEKLPLY